MRSIAGAQQEPRLCTPDSPCPAASNSIRGNSSSTPGVIVANNQVSFETRISFSLAFSLVSDGGVSWRVVRCSLRGILHGNTAAGATIAVQEPR